ncbi:hypothetical protein [Acidicapsa ligni]|uniref:hypothetical protein n=1 Tax=Acidicapsa ligni TaxID=542300 RepID=UPI0021DF6913|nr:hypothetical protein [Acidicapsa ligni]
MEYQLNREARNREITEAHDRLKQVKTEIAELSKESTRIGNTLVWVGNNLLSAPEKVVFEGDNYGIDAFRAIAKSSIPDLSAERIRSLASELRGLLKECSTLDKFLQ